MLVKCIIYDTSEDPIDPTEKKQEHTLLFKSWAHQGCIYLIKNTVKIVILCDIITI